MVPTMCQPGTPYLYAPTTTAATSGGHARLQVAGPAQHCSMAVPMLGPQRPGGPQPLVPMHGPGGDFFNVQAPPAPKAVNHDVLPQLYHDRQSVRFHRHPGLATEAIPCRGPSGDHATELHGKRNNNYYVIL